MSAGAGVDDLLDEGSVVGYLRSRGLVRPDSSPAVRSLGGGISNVVLMVEAEGSSKPGLVVKQSLGRINVAEHWVASRRRTLTEGITLRMAAEMTPGRVPGVVDLDAERLVLVIQAAPADWVCLKEELLDGRVDPTLAEELGAALAVWHSETAGTPLDVEWADPNALRELRTDPFHRVAAERNPDLAPVLHECREELETTHTCFVHGDFSPKNMLVGPDGWWVLDFEAAHLGAPVFDVAYVTCHLVLKAVHRPSHRVEYQAASAALWQTYTRAAGESVRPAPDRLALHTGCLLLARVDGRSIAEYLDDDGRARTHALAAGLLQRPVRDLEELWHRVDNP